MTPAFDFISITARSQARELTYEVDGRALVNLKVNDELYSSEHINSIKLIVKEIICYGRTLDEIHPTMGCTIIVSANTNINTESQYLYKGQ